MEMPLTFEYDEVGDILYINKIPPYPEQETEQLAYNVLARRNPRTGVVENLEILFFTRWLLKGDHSQINNLKDLFAEHVFVEGEVHH
ncbi:MAG: hypothetical protein A3F84_17625 [Candidatus Handelsmanbacteria bacterium RIFCSPLOWO2_12_FULL_64_10]|uniref:DUF2283 domain-containing protein n=1 Tax=Handelsmanbacteria sp. (strain RIFCSPLOWO2_12_FULL_64_10) TaxID=1817868 RepID=A0A1F6D7E8_HANXR|nr:MAG: hypothetical protein A3F84_17625 [Candidatus Handelsmanbacteria bacterium RIFCSPLOWO2_12_FULL_64_10]